MVEYPVYSLKFKDQAAQRSEHFLTFHPTSQLPSSGAIW